jgi:hypothetical protein
LLLELLPATGEAIRARLAIARSRSVEVHELLQALRNSVRDTSDDVPAVRMSDQDDIRQIFVEQHVDDVLDVGVQTDIR